MILLAFSFEGFKRSKMEAKTSPKSVKTTNGRNQKETNCQSNGRGVKKTAER